MRRRTKRESWVGSTDDRPRVLLECGPESSPSIIAPIIERHGFEVRVCEGPSGTQSCGLIDDGICSLVDGADVVVNMMATPVDAPMVLDAVTGIRRPPAVVTTESTAARSEIVPIETAPIETAPIETGPSVDPSRTETGPPVTVMHGAVTTATLINAIHDALERSRRPQPMWGDGFC